MTMLRCNLAVSLDGYVAGPDQGVDNPLGSATLTFASSSSGSSLRPA
jgi:hypothetical protein